MKCGRKDGDMGVGVGVCRMQITPHFLDEDAGRTANICHGRIQKANHEVVIIAAPAQWYRFSLGVTMRLWRDHMRQNPLL